MKLKKEPGRLKLFIRVIKNRIDDLNA